MMLNKWMMASNLQIQFSANRVQAFPSQTHRSCKTLHRRLRLLLLAPFVWRSCMLHWMGYYNYYTTAIKHASCSLQAASWNLQVATNSISTIKTPIWLVVILRLFSIIHVRIISPRFWDYGSPRKVETIKITLHRKFVRHCWHVHRLVDWMRHGRPTMPH